MARWDPGTQDRLFKAALELYSELGYDSVTVTQIAERAGITRRSYFRYFPDKREVLFVGSERLPVALRQAVLDATDTSTPLATALQAFADVGSQLTARLDHAADRRAVIRTSAELQERERTKHAAVTAAIRDALRERGTEPQRAHLTAQIAALIFQNAFDQWLDGDRQSDFVTCLDAATASFRDAAGGEGQAQG
ncbi:transcriptional regulator BetI [Streptomyces sp. YIM 130001]|uniref:TetR/AcrR family transcriptional regulator n=1 Tax=Streptomyces sp. YIM 130001 TaxID=2259644 RepID=UPI000E64F41D|nr:TetR/AcrR family transcriptional regulator [Streptomyces sp. YIM 130001]RII20455.1 transcriptional regulator BetI [Streptomyces sp. YIM 130001]